MSNKRTIQLPWTTVYADSTTVRFLPDAALMETAGLEQVRVTWELEQATSANLRVEPAYRLGNSIDTMDSTSSELWTGGPLGTGGVHYPGGWIVVATPTVTQGAPIDGEEAVPRVTNLPSSGTIVSSQEFELGSAGDKEILEAHHGAWSPKGNKIMVHAHDEVQRDGEAEYRGLYVYRLDDAIGRWVPEVEGGSQATPAFDVDVARLKGEFPALASISAGRPLAFKFGEWCGQDDYVVACVFATDLDQEIVASRPMMFRRSASTAWDLATIIERWLDRFQQLGGLQRHMLHILTLLACRSLPVDTAVVDTAPPPLPTDVPFSRVSVGAGLVCGLHTNGRIQCWGEDAELSDWPTGMEDGFDDWRAYKDLSLARWNDLETTAFYRDLTACALDLDGALHCWSEWPVYDPGPWDRVAALESKGALVMRSDGTFRFWRRGSVQVEGVFPSGDGQIRDLGVSADGACVLWDSGAADCVSSRGEFQSFDGPHSAIWVGSYTVHLVTPEGEEQVWTLFPGGEGSGKTGLASVLAALDDVAVEASGSDWSSNRCARTAAGQVACTINEGPPPYEYAPVPVNGWAQVSTAASPCACGLTPDGRIGCWGHPDDASGTDLECRANDVDDVPTEYFFVAE